MSEGTQVRRGAADCPSKLKGPPTHKGSGGPDVRLPSVPYSSLRPEQAKGYGAMLIAPLEALIAALFTQMTLIL